MNRIHRQSGAALVTVLLILAVAIIIASEMSSRLFFGLTRTQILNNNQQAMWYAIAAEETAKRYLMDNFMKKDVVHLKQQWATKLEKMPVDEGTLTAEVTDLQACFNLNALSKPDPVKKAKKKQSGSSSNSSNKTSESERQRESSAKENESQKSTRNPESIKMFKRLIELLEIETEYTAEDLATRIYDWMDADGIPRNGSEDEDDYAALVYPYLPSNTLMSSESELRAVSGFHPAIYQKLRPYICVIPEEPSLLINVNTVPEDRPELIAAILDIDKDEASNIISNRGEEGYKDFGSIWSNNPSAVSGQDKEKYKAYFDVTSKHFKVDIKTEFDDGQFYLTSYIQITDEKKANIIARRVGGPL